MIFNYKHLQRQTALQLALTPRLGHGNEGYALRVKRPPQHRIRVCHIASGDLWAGAEVLIAGLLEELKTFPDLEVSAVLLNNGRLCEELTTRNIPVNVYDETQLNYLQVLQALYSHLREQKLDVVHTHRYKENILGGVAAKFSGVPVTVHTVHGLQEKLKGWRLLKMNAYSWVNSAIAKWMNQSIIGVSEEITSVMRQQFPRNPVVCIHNGINVKKVRPTVSSGAKRRELGIPEDEIVIGTVGRLVPVKGMEYLLKAISALCESLREVPVRLLVVGDGLLRSKLEALAKELNIDQKTLFLGERDDVYDLMNLFDIYALPSLHEGIPMALLEAMALRRPIVASRVGGIPEVVTDMEDGRLVPAQDVNALSHVLKELALSRALREQVGKAGQERVAQSYDRGKMASEVRELYWYLVNKYVECPKEFNFIEKDHRREAI